MSPIQCTRTTTVVNDDAQGRYRMCDLDDAVKHKTEIEGVRLWAVDIQSKAHGGKNPTCIEEIWLIEGHLLDAAAQIADSSEIRSHLPVRFANSTHSCCTQA